MKCDFDYLTGVALMKRLLGQKTSFVGTGTDLKNEVVALIALNTSPERASNA